MSEADRPYDVAIIGSGFGGAVAACRLSVAGKRVVVLERGRRWHPDDYPRKPGDAWFYNRRHPYRKNGWMELRPVDGDMIVVTGAGVGGGSLIYASVSIDARDEVFDTGWPSEVTAGVLKPYYERVGEMLRPKPVPQGQEPVRLTLMKKAAAALDAEDRFMPLDLAVTFSPNWHHGIDGPDGDPTRAKYSEQWRNPQRRWQGTCTHCGECDIGCKRQAKNTLDLNYLAVAEDCGAEIRPLCQVSHIAPAAGGAWEVHFRNASYRRRRKDSVVAHRVVVAAGSLGSTEILLRSRDEFGTLPDLPAALGKGWSSNGDFVTPARYDGQTWAPTNGPTISSAIDFLDGAGSGRFFIEDGGIPNLANVLFDARRRAKAGSRFMAWLHRRAEFGSIMLWFGQAIDGSDGDFRLGRRRIKFWERTLRLDWNPRRSGTAIDAMARMHRELSKATGGRPLPRLMWSWFRGLVTPHPLGGCNMASSPAAGVVDHAGRVFGHPGLYVMDGSIIPRAIGRNPSKTIAAVAERAVALLLAEDGTSTQRNR